MNKIYNRLIISLVAVSRSVLTTPAAARQSFQGLGDFTGGIFNSQANGISADGSVVAGGSNSASGFEAFVWSNVFGLVGLGDLVPTNRRSKEPSDGGHEGVE